MLKPRIKLETYNFSEKSLARERPPRSEHSRRIQTTRGHDTQPSQPSAQRATAKGKAIALATPLERIELDNETPSQSLSTTHSVHRHGDDMDSSASTDDGSDAKESMVPSTQFQSSAWTEE